MQTSGFLTERDSDVQNRNTFLLKKDDDKNGSKIIVQSSGIFDRSVNEENLKARLGTHRTLSASN